MQKSMIQANFGSSIVESCVPSIFRGSDIALIAPSSFLSSFPVVGCSIFRSHHEASLILLVSMNLVIRSAAQITSGKIQKHSPIVNMVENSNGVSALWSLRRSTGMTAL